MHIPILWTALLALIISSIIQYFHFVATFQQVSHEPLAQSIDPARVRSPGKKIWHKMMVYGLCSCILLLSLLCETIGHLIAYHALDEDTNYHGLGLNTLQQNVNRNGDTYFFCGGEKERAIGSIRCKECDDGLVRIQSAYEVFDTDNVKEFCRFLKKAEDKTQWRAFKRSLKGTKGIITVDKRLTSNRTIRFEISRDKVQILDDRRNDKCKESSPKNGNVHCNFLIKLFDKWLPVSITYCQGITG